ncbi:MAG: DUF86 domain-containing protein [Spirochaetes bacterium]|nr:DUF86 domain-containing protein [Spirochaetota bacterium]MBN2770778.1 DUF86 domain-containing protein [Spirochaetota bacterium]
MSEKDKLNLQDIIDAINKIQEYSKNISSLEEFEKNSIIFDAVLMNIIVIGESANRLSDFLKENNAYIEWNKIKGLRNIIAHDYFGIDIEEIYQIIIYILPEFLDQINIILKQL